LDRWFDPRGYYNSDIKIKIKKSGSREEAAVAVAAAVKKGIKKVAGAVAGSVKKEMNWLNKKETVTITKTKTKNCRCYCRCYLLKKA